ncbi:MAG: flagellin [Candidatus Hinthialibacter antarcticus]|nr:flagellin [Candidatus Hinthialibacter antarcticus]
MTISRIVNNVASVNANRNLDNSQRALSKSIERLSSGLRINRAGDDAAGLTVANRLRTQVQGLNQAVTNASQGINLIATAEGALEETTTRLNRIRQLAVQSANTAVNDLGARRALQDEVFQSIDEVTRIANTTQFSSNFLLNGDFSIQSETIDGQEDIGLSVDASPVASTLGSGKSFLNIIKTIDGSSQIIAGDKKGETQVLNTGITNQTDFAVSMAFFSEGNLGVGSAVGSSTGINATTDVMVHTGGGAASKFFNGVSISRTDVFVYSGVLSDGVTQFNGSISATHVGAAITFAGFTSSINSSINAAEAALFGDSASVPDEYRTLATAEVGAAGRNASNAGRIRLSSENGELINQASLNITLVSSVGTINTSANGVTRSGEIGTDSALAGQGQVGNSITAITGSTFGAGQFDIQVEDVQAAQQRKVESTVTFRDGNGAILNRTVSLDGAGSGRTLELNGSFVNGVYTGGTTLASGDTVTLTGSNSDGTTFQSSFTFNTVPGAGDFDASFNDFTFSSISGLVSEMNFRTSNYGAAGTLGASTLTGGLENGNQTRFEDALFTFTANGSMQLVDDTGKDDSETAFTLTFDFQQKIDGAGVVTRNQSTVQDDALLQQEGFFESAAFRVDGGDAVRAKAGDVITLAAAEATVEGVPQEQLTFRVGSGFSAGVDKLETSQDQFVGKLNGGSEVTFTNGDQDVVFIDGNSGGTRGVAKFVTVDFDNVVDVTQRADGLPDAGRTVIISTVNSSLNFQVGANAGQAFRASIGDLRSENLGFGQGSGRTVSDIDITTIDGANEAIRIVDEALGQVNKTRSILGAATNRLEATISNLSVSAENLTAAESRIRDADIARESSDFTKNQVLLQAGVSILAQANFQSQSFLGLIG